MFRKSLNFPNFRRYSYSSLFQNITNQLIELERHFNGLELNKFGGNEESQVSERALQRKFGSSRYFHFLFLALRCKTFVIFVLLLFLIVLLYFYSYTSFTTFWSLYLLSKSLFIISLQSFVSNFEHVSKKILSS